MTVRRLLDVNIATLAFLGALLLGIRQQSSFLPLATLIAATASVWLTDVTGWFRLNRLAGNTAAFAVVAISVWSLARSPRPLEILTMVEILAYVQIVLLFQKKDLRTRWDLAALSLVEVLAAGASDQGVMFGSLLVVYMFVGLSALALLFLDRERVRYQQLSQTATPAGFSSGAPDRERTDWVRLGKIAMAAFVVGPVALFLRYRQTARRRQATDGSSALGSDGRGPHPAGRQPAAGGGSTGPTGRDAVGWDFWGRLARTGLFTLAITPAVFVLLPRFGRFNIGLPRLRRYTFEQTDEAPARIVGFSDRVALGELGKLIENAEEVLQIRFVDHAAGQIYPVQGDVYLRGAVLTRYESGQWRYEGPNSGGRSQLLGRDDLPPDAALVRQYVHMKPMDRDELFCVWPFVVIRGDGRLRYDARLERLRRLPSSRDEHFSFLLGTTAFVDGKQTELVAGRNPVEPRFLLQMPAGALPRLVAMADQWIEESQIRPGDRLRLARYLDERLRRSGQFQHSMEGQPRDSTLDPIEDFIANNQSGNCEYFATSLTLMLRSQGIPARLVVGYRSDEYDYLDQLYRVRQLHAHTWVEAYLAPEHLPPELPPSGPFDWSAGAWLRLDPTPSAGLAGMTRLMEGMENWLDWLRFVWTNYVIGMSGSQQRRLIYQPVVAFVEQTLQRLTSPDWWKGLFRRAGRALGVQPGTWSGGRWLIWGAITVAVLVALVWAVVYRGFRFGLGRIPFRLTRRARSKRRRDRTEVEFYRRLEAMLARRGLVRGDCQTQREFAREAGSSIAQSTGQGHLEGLPLQVAEAFYCVRFGAIRLDDSQTEAVETALSGLQHATDGRRRAAPSGWASRGPYGRCPPRPSP